MPNTYFQFKQFCIDQADVAMKVTTEGCILGAWIDPGFEPKRILDIGTGTGLLALMAAQKFLQARIDAVEVEMDAYNQAKANFNNSPWRDRLQARHQRVQDFNPGFQYDLIITNPPFFNHSLLSPKSALNTAKHDAGLPQADLIACIKRMLKPNGCAYVLYPPAEAQTFSELARKNGLFLSRRLRVFNAEKHPQALRWMGMYRFAEHPVREEVLIIKNKEDRYTDDVIQLLKPYYLHL